MFSPIAPSTVATAVKVPSTITRSTMEKNSFQNIHLYIKKFSSNPKDFYVSVAEALDAIVDAHVASKTAISSKRKNMSRELNKELSSDGRYLVKMARK